MHDPAKKLAARSAHDMMLKATPLTRHALDWCEARIQKDTSIYTYIEIIFKDYVQPGWKISHRGINRGQYLFQL